MQTDQPFDIQSLQEAYAKGLKVEDVVRECYRRIEAVGDPGIFLYLADMDAVLAEAKTLGPFDPRTKPLWGIPFAVKDNIDAAGLPTTAACPDFEYTAVDDAFVVKALRGAGALLIGKTNLDQFATGLVGVRTPYPFPVNALDPAIVPGGSSSGSGVVVAHGIVSFALGTDTAGSGRVPAALNGIVGLKPTLGAFSNTGVVPACRTLDTISVFALTVDDAYGVFQAAAVYDEADSYARRLPAPAPTAPAPRLKVGVPDAQSLEFCGDDVQAASFAASVESLKTLGAEIVEIDFAPFYTVAEMLYDGVWVAERYAAVAEIMRDKPSVMHPVTRAIIEVADKFDAVDTFKSQYKLQDLKRRLAPVLASVDMLCVPTIPTFFTVADLEADPFGPNAKLGTYTNFVNLLDMCGIAVPTSARGDGRPGSVTLLAPAGRDAEIASFAALVQQQGGGALGATGWPLPLPPARTSAAANDEIAIVAVGAHMSGLPLNHQLTALGARFLKEAETAPEYKLYSLPGVPPARPGLVRDEDGSSIAVEVWALPKEKFADFIADVPQPLGIGTLTLKTGEQVKGFICEPCGVAGAEDVTRFGGWRAYLASQQSPKDQTKEKKHV